MGSGGREHYSEGRLKSIAKRTLRCWQLNDKTSSLSEHTVYRHTAPQQVGKIFYDIKPHPNPALGSSSPGVDLPKLIEYELQLIRRNTDSRIFHIKHHFSVFRLMTRRYANFTLIGELNCVIDEVEQNNF